MTDAEKFDVLNLNRDQGRLSVELSLRDKRTQDLLWQYAARCRMVDPVFSREVQDALTQQGFTLATPKAQEFTDLMEKLAYLPDGALGYAHSPVPPYKVDIIPLAILGLRHAIEVIKRTEVQQEKANDGT